jgi:hypothetical protein
MYCTVLDRMFDLNILFPCRSCNILFFPEMLLTCQFLLLQKLSNWKHMEIWRIIQSDLKVTQLGSKCVVICDNVMKHDCTCNSWHHWLHLVIHSLRWNIPVPVVLCLQQVQQVVFPDAVCSELNFVLRPVICTCSGRVSRDIPILRSDVGLQNQGWMTVSVSIILLGYVTPESHYMNIIFACVHTRTHTHTHTHTQTNKQTKHLHNKGKVKLSLCFNRISRHEGVLGKWKYSSTHS